MSTQINLRLSPKLFSTVQEYVENHGYGNMQEFIRETIREKVYQESNLTYDELTLIKKLARVSEENNLYETEEELFRKLNMIQ